MPSLRKIPDNEIQELIEKTRVIVQRPIGSALTRAGLDYQRAAVKVLRDLEREQQRRKETS